MRWGRGAALGLTAPLLASLVLGCGSSVVPVVNPGAADWDPPLKLSAYFLFRGTGATQEPADDVVPYDIGTPLFADYAAKYRFVRLPPGTQATYDSDQVFDFPIGTILVKTFAFLHDRRDPSRGQQLVETRLLIHRPEGWIGLPYIWNDEQTDAELRIVGGVRHLQWIHDDGKERSDEYRVPNVNQCMACHENQKVMRPIGPKARNLNKDFAYSTGLENQLSHWKRGGILRGVPPPDQAPRLSVWNDPSSGSLDQRARAWLENNCAHCHNPDGPARTSGLDLMAAQMDPYKRGVMKPPVAAGRGSGGRSFDIVPGKPEDSILLYRIESTESGILMPELGRSLVDEEGVALIREWIAKMHNAVPVIRDEQGPHP